MGPPADGHEWCLNFDTKKVRIFGDRDPICQSWPAGESQQLLRDPQKNPPVEQVEEGKLRLHLGGFHPRSLV